VRDTLYDPSTYFLWYVRSNNVIRGRERAEHWLFLQSIAADGRVLGVHFTGRLPQPLVNSQPSKKALSKAACHIQAKEPEP
jgi:hypothetical protein